MTESSSLARIGGALYLLTHVTSVAAVVAYGGAPVSPLATRTAVLAGALLEIVLALAVVGTGVALYPLLRPHSEAVAVGYLALRTLEAGVILVGVVVLLPVVAAPATTAGVPLPAETAAALRLVHDWTFLVGPGLVVPVHTVLLARLLLRRALMPRAIPLLGLVGGPLIGAVNLAVGLGLTDAIAVAAVPVFAWEVSLAVCLLVRGLRTDAAATHPAAAAIV